MRLPSHTVSLILAGATLTAVLAAPAGDYVLRPGVSAGGIRARTSLVELKRRFGASVVAKDVYGPEGTTFPGAVLHGKDPRRRAEVIWAEGQVGKRVDMVRVGGRLSRWRTPEGVTVGLSLAALERINGAPITFSGFGWDYGGVVSSFGKGRLARHGGKLQIHLSSGDPARIPDAEYEKLSGDRQVKSNNPWVRKLGATVDEVSIRL